MKTQNIFIPVAMLAIFVLAALNTVIGLVQSVVEVIQAIVAAILFVAKIACKAVKSIQQVLHRLDWVLSAIDGIVDFVHSSLENWMVSTVQPEPVNKSTLLLASAKPFPSERTAFEEYTVKATTNSLELVVAPTKPLMLTGAKPFPLERTAFERHAQSVIANSLELAVTEPVEVTAEPLGKAITIGKETELIALSFPGVYVQRTPKKKKSKSELSKLTIPQLRDRIAKIVENNNSLVVPRSKVKKAVLVDWLLAN